MPDIEILLFASELRTRAWEILARAANTDNLEVQETMREVATGYQQLAQQVEQRIREVEMA